jgi:membrane protein
MKPQRLLRLSQKAVMAWIDDFAPSMGAAISYYTMFSLAPLLVIVIAVAGVLFGREAVQGEIVGQLKGLIGLEGAMAVQGLMRSASEPSRGLAAGLISAVVVLVGATTVFAELQSALDRIWHVPEKAKPSGVWAVLRARVLSFGLILGLAFMLMVSLVTSAAVAALGSWASGLLPAWEVTLQALNTAAALAITTVLFAMIFKFMPSVRLQWHDVWVGAAVTAVLFELGKFAIGMYLGKSGVDEAFAAAGSLVVVLAWVYYAAQIFLLGAEFTKVYAEERGSQAGADAVAATRTGAAVAAAGTDLTPGVLPAAALEATPTAAQAGSHAAPTELEILQARTRQQQVHLGLLAAVAVGQLALLRWRRQQLQRLLGRAASSRDS